MCPPVVITTELSFFPVELSFVMIIITVMFVLRVEFRNGHEVLTLAADGGGVFKMQITALLIVLIVGY